MNFICTNCGQINDNESFICANCNTKIDEIEYFRLIDYARRAFHYGYSYRVEYEKQVAEHGEVQAKYSLFQPDQWYEWLAMAALSGAVGTYTTDLVKYVSKKILDMFSKKAAETGLSAEEQRTVDFLTDNGQLNKFSVYIIAYYNGLPRIDKRVEEAIIEEEMAHVASEDMREEFEQFLLNLDPNDKKGIGETFLKIARASGQKRREKPTIEQTKLLLKALKQDLKQEKKKQKKRR